MIIHDVLLPLLLGQFGHQVFFLFALFDLVLLDLNEDPLDNLRLEGLWPCSPRATG